MDHPSLSMKVHSTIHTRWHITTSPLYKIEFGDLVNMMEIEGLVGASLPAFLSSEANPVAKGNEADTPLPSPVTFTVPKNKAKRYNAVNSVAGRICELAKHDAEVFKMVIPQLNQMYQNCMLMRESKSEKAEAAKMLISAAQTQLPIVPETIQRDIADDKNLGNATYNKPNKKRKAKK